MEDYPRNLTEFEARFSSEEACREYLFRLRWPDGFRCPGCGGGKSWPLRKVLLPCAACGRQTSVTAGTIFQDTRTPLPLWFRAMWWVTTQKNGASALGLQRVLGLNRYETAWTWLHKMRRAMVRPGRDLLAGRVEVDESYLGGLEEGLRGRNLKNKALIAVAAQQEGRGIGRIRMKRIEDASGQSLVPFVEECIELGSVVLTDGWPGYCGLEKEGFIHEVTVVSRQEKSASELMPGVHRVMSLLKRWLLGTHQGAVSPKHLDYYLDEFTFRFNRRKSRNRGKLFYRLVQQAVAVEPATYKMIVRPVTKPKKIPKWGIHLTQVAPRRCGLVDPWTPAHCTQNAPWGARRRSAGNWATRLRFGPIKDYARAMAIAGLETWCYRQAFPGAANGQPQYVVVT